MTNIEINNLILALFVAVTSGLVGSFALMRRMALAGDAISHIALPGLAFALIYTFNPLAGAGVALLIGAIAIWKVEKISGLNTETVTGVLFALSLAIGGLMVKDEHALEELLFGSEQNITLNEFIIGLFLSLLIILFILKKRHALTLSLVSRELAATAGIKNDRLQLYFLIIFSLTVLLGIKFLGVLLMGSLIIIPAAASRNISASLNSTLIISVLLSLTSVIVGILMSNIFELTIGPSVVCVAGALFFITLFFKKR